MDATFRIAVVISTIIHSVIFIPVFSLRDARENRPIVVDYVKLKDSVITPHRPKPILKAAFAPSVLIAKADMSANREAGDKSKTAKREARELARKQAPLKGKKDYINYYHLIREKIRGQLKERYVNRHHEGEIVLIFILDLNGSLVVVETDDTRSVQDEFLRRMALESVRDAAPFPPFPKELAVPKMSFDLTVSFKES